MQSCPGVSLQTKLHTRLQECSRRGVPVRTPSQAGHMAWDLNGQKTNQEEAGTGAGASRGYVCRQTTGRWLPRRRTRTRTPEPSGSGARAGRVHTGQRAAVRRLPAAQGLEGTEPAGVRMPGRARSLSLSPTAAMVTRRRSKAVEGTQGRLQAPDAAGPQEEAETEGHGWGLQQGLGGSRTASVVPVTGSPVPGGQ